MASFRFQVTPPRPLRGDFIFGKDGGLMLSLELVDLVVPGSEAGPVFRSRLISGDEFFP